MTKSSQHLGMGAWIGIGFIVVLTLMLALSAIGLRYVADANQRLKDIARNNNVKIELATKMHSALRERALSMHALPILADPFDKDAEIQRFNIQGVHYIQAREQLEQMPLSPKESDILKQIRDLTRKAQPEVQAVVEMSPSTTTTTTTNKKFSTGYATLQCHGSGRLRTKSWPCWNCNASRQRRQSIMPK